MEGETSAKIAQSISSSLKDGSDFRVLGAYRNPQEIIRHSPDFESVIVVLQQIKIDEELHPEAKISDEQSARRDADGTGLREKLALSVDCNLLRDIGPPWNWLHNFASQTCREQSYNFLESAPADVTATATNEPASSDESFDYLNDKFVSVKASEADSKSSVSGASGVSFSLYKADEGDDMVGTNHHQVLIDTICCISEASERGECSIRATSSIASLLDAQHSKRQLQDDDHERLKGFIARAEQSGIVFNDLNELYNYFIQESTRERSCGVEIREEDGDEEEPENLIGSTDDAQPEDLDKDVKHESKNVVSIFGESGIEVDGKLLDAKVSERMILGLVDKPPLEEASDVASSVSSLSNAETVKPNVTRERDTQTPAYDELMHVKRTRVKQAGKSKSASSIKRQPFTCKIPPIPGIGPTMDEERLERILRFITHRSYQQGGLVYPRNLLETGCPSLLSSP